MYVCKVYSNTAGLKSHHHIRIDGEFKSDCRMWLQFLSEDRMNAVCRPFTDFSKVLHAVDINFSSDVARSEFLGFGCVMGTQWCYEQWEPGFIAQYKPSIDFLELYALAVGVYAWGSTFANTCVLIRCDNQAVVGMINSTTSSCHFCMVLIRQITLKCLHFNCRIHAEYIKSKDNILLDLLSRMKIAKIKEVGKNMGLQMAVRPIVTPVELWPLRSYWDRFCQHSK